ncbi:MAG: hypothetical protein IT374_02480 [Polyangiaceae bacterium]|nr:hypothetical protein [Polyangiaceae bacterium]
MTRSGAPTGARWLLVFGAFGALGVLAACSGRPANSGGQAAPRERGRATDASKEAVDDQTKCDFKGRDDREVSETAGMGTILPNVRKVYQVFGTGEDRRKVLVCREVDSNLDGIKDVVRTFTDKGEAASEQADSNFDGKIDTWITFAGGRVSKLAVDRDGDGQPDIWNFYVGGQLSRVQRDTTKDGKPDVWEFYNHGRLERMGVDLDGDGSVDRWDHDEIARRAAEAAEKAEERSAGGARVDPSGSASAPAAATLAPITSAAPPAKPKSKQVRDREKKGK